MEILGSLKARSLHSAALPRRASPRTDIRQTHELFPITASNSLYPHQISNKYNTTSTFSQNTTPYASSNSNFTYTTNQPKTAIMSSSSPPTLKKIQPLAFILNVQMTIKTANVPTFLAAIKPAYDAVLREPQCAFFNLGQRHPLNPLTGERNATEAEDETVISFSEGWNCTLEYFKEVQLKKEYYGPYQAVTVPLYTKPRELLYPFFS